MKRLTCFITLLFLSLCVSAQTWTTHFAYNSVDQVAEGNGVVFAVSSGALFSVDAQSEQIRTYSNQDGMHGTNIACISWLEAKQTLMIVYADGKMDMLHNGTFRFIPDLYNKFTTLSKLCHSITVKDSLAYMAMDYGVQTFNIHRREFVDTYFIGSEAKEIPVYSVALTSHAIYAAGESTLYAASLDDNIVDYSYWSQIPLPAEGRIQGLAQANDRLYILLDNTCYYRSGTQWMKYSNLSYNALNVIDGNIYPAAYPVVSYEGLWTAAGTSGLQRTLPTGESTTYSINGPLNNIPYRLTYQKDQLFMLSGGRWADKYNRPGCVMRYDGKTWHNITQQDITRSVGAPCLDMMNVAADPSDANHYFVTSYGTGLYEFRNDKCIKRWNSTNSIIGSAVLDAPGTYTRTDGAIYDAKGNLWLLASGDVNYNIVVLTADNEQVGLNVNLEDNTRATLHTATQILFDRSRPDYVWVLASRKVDGAGALALLDTKGTLTHVADDRSIVRNTWIDSNGQSYSPEAIYAMRQDSRGNIWLATDEGVLIVETNDYFDNAQCSKLQLTDRNNMPVMEDEEIYDIVFDYFDRPWIATQKSGIYVLDPESHELLEHFSMENSAMPSNSVISLACDARHRRMFVGTALGLVAYTDPTSDVNAAEESTYDTPVDYGSVLQWTTHFSYSRIDRIQISPKYVYGLSSESLLAVDRSDESLIYYSKLNGLNGSAVHRIDYDSYTNTLVISYEDGMFDLLDDNGNIRNLPDLYAKQISASKLVQDLVFREGKAYMAMPFGILVINIRKREITDTYYIGDQGAAVSVNAVTIVGDSIFAATADRLYSASLSDNLSDFTNWHYTPLSGKVTHLQCSNGDMYMLMDSVIYCNSKPLPADERFVMLMEHQGSILARSNTDSHIFEVSASAVSELPALSAQWPYFALKEGNTYWLSNSNGLMHILADGSKQRYQPDGPLSNLSYSLTAAGADLWMVMGGRWASQYNRTGWVMRYNGSQWNNITYSDICKRLGSSPALHDFGHVAVDATDNNHYYVACYGTGLLEFLPDGTAKHYTHNNSPLISLVDNNKDNFCRVDAMAYDAEGNLWLTNTGDLATNIHVLDPNHSWHSFNLYQGGQRIVLNTVSKFLVDNRNPNYKWIASARSNAGIILHYDNGTPYVGTDDRSVIRSTFIDQDGKGVSFNELYTIAQDYNGDIWLGTAEGIIVIKDSTNMFTSNACHRMKMSRHDGTGLADYLLGTEQINSIVFAGGNRVWIGTQNSGAYLVRFVTKESIYEPEIVAHFTSQNSPMPSDCVLSIAIDNRGEVFIGTAKGLVSYRGDATEPEESYSSAYVYPNPVRPNYEGSIAITGLMDNTVVYIADAAGNVVCRTRSNGGTAIWDGRTLSGSKAHSGVYTIYCNTADGKNHTALKLLIMH